MSKSDYTADGKFRRLSSNPGALVSADYAGLAAYRDRKRRSAEIDNAVTSYTKLSDEVREIKAALDEVIRMLKK